MTKVTLKYTAIVVGEVEIEVPDDSADAVRDAIRLARAKHPFLRTAQFEPKRADDVKPDEVAAV